MIAKFDNFEISPIHSGDAWKICDFAVINESRMRRFFPETLKQNLTPDLSQIFVDSKVKAFENKQEFLFTLKQYESRKLAGIIYLKEIDWQTKQGEFAYCIDYRFEGKGLTSKAVNLISSYAFKNLKLQTLQIISHKSNQPSIKVALNNNFKWVKTLEKSFAPPDEKALDMELYVKNIIF